MAPSPKRPALRPLHAARPTDARVVADGCAGSLKFEPSDWVGVTERLSRRLSRRWHALSSPQRRRIVLGSLFALSLAFRDALLLAVAGGLFALSELAPAPQARLPAAG